MADPSQKGKSRKRPAAKSRVGELTLLELVHPEKWTRKQRKFVKEGLESLRRIKRLMAAFDRWNVSEDEADARAAVKRLEKFWERWSPEQCEWFLRTAENIAIAETTKKAWNPKANRIQYESLGKSAIRAAQLAKQLGALFPPPWKDERAAIGDLVIQLVGYVRGALEATIPTEKAVEIRLASKNIRRIRRSITKKTGHTHWELLLDLARLASRGENELDISERTIRRYLKNRSVSKTPADVYWKSNWELIRTVSRLVPARPSKAFEKAAKLYLKSLS